MQKSGIKNLNAGSSFDPKQQRLIGCIEENPCSWEHSFLKDNAGASQEKNTPLSGLHFPLLESTNSLLHFFNRLLVIGWNTWQSVWWNSNIHAFSLIKPLRSFFGTQNYFSDEMPFDIVNFRHCISERALYANISFRRNFNSNVWCVQCIWISGIYEESMRISCLKFWIFSGFGLEACFLLGVGYTRNPTTAMVCLTIAVGCSGFAISGELKCFIFCYHNFRFSYDICSTFLRLQ